MLQYQVTPCESVVIPSAMSYFARTARSKPAHSTFLQKPFRVVTLLRKVASLLEAADR